MTTAYPTATTPAQPTYVPPTTPVAPSPTSTLFAKLPFSKKQRTWGGIIVGTLLLIVLTLHALPNLLLPRVVTVVGSTKIEFEAERAEIGIVYLTRGADRQALQESGKVEFELVIQKLSTLPISSLQKSPGQVVPGATGAFEYRQAAVLKVTDAANIREVTDFLSRENVFVARITYLPKDDVSIQQTLLDGALAQARTKAEGVARSSGKRLGKLVSVTEIITSTDQGSIISGSSNTIDGSQQVPTVELEKAVNATYALE